MPDTETSGTTGVDATLVLGLAGKATQVFAEPGTYLSFPLAPIGIERARLEALARDALSPEGQAALVEFSLLVNEIPAGPVWQPDGDRLWEVYGDVLSDVELAEPVRTPAEEADYLRAYALLHRAQQDGGVAESPPVVAYEQCRDAYIAAAQEYNNRKGQAEFGDDPAITRAWVADEPLLLARVAQAEEEWAATGHRAEVEEARRLLREFGSRSPQTAWAGYRKLFDPDLPEIYFRTAPDGSLYLPTAYLPADVSSVSWPTITVTGTALAALAASAPEGLRARLSGGASDDAVELVSFEYSSVTVHRPWFAPEVFASRAWRFYESGRILSDGGTPPTGGCTAYVSGLVLARNITVRRRVGARPRGGLGFLPGAHLPVVRPAIRPYRVEDLARRGEVRRAIRATRPRAPRVLRPASSVVVHDHRAGRPRTSTVVIAGTRKPAQAPPAPPPVPPGAAARTTASDPNEVYVIAFLCRLLPKSPDPNPALTFDGAPDDSAPHDDAHGEPGFINADLMLTVGTAGASLRPRPAREGAPIPLAPGMACAVDGYTDQGEAVMAHPIAAERARWYHRADGSGWVHASGLVSRG